MDTAPVESMAAKPLPPGSLGLPWIGETLAFVKDSFAFFAERHEKHGPVFRTRLLGEPVICLIGPDAVGFFYDPRYFTRVDASLPQLRELLHPEAIPFLDQSPAHAARRQLLLQAFTPEALAGYVPFLERITRRYLGSWERTASLLWVPELQAIGPGKDGRRKHQPPGPSWPPICKSHASSLVSGRCALSPPVSGRFTFSQVTCHLLPAGFT
jgi:hypothetical protein